MSTRERLRAFTAGAVIACVAGAGLGFALPAPVVAAGVVLAAALAAATVGCAWRHHRLARRLRACSHPGRVGGIAVRLGALSGSAFVAGLRRPEIYCDRRLPALLNSAELRAVALHERAHQIARDPVRLTLLAAVTPVVRRLPGGRAWLAGVDGRWEIAADRYALERGASRAALASALLKVRPATGPAPGFSPAVDQRLRALLDDSPPPAPSRWGLRLAGAALGTAVCVALLHPSLGLLERMVGS